MSDGDFRQQVKEQFLAIAKLAEEASQSTEVHHTWAKCLTEWRGALRDALAVHEAQQAEIAHAELIALRDELRALKDELHGGRAGYMEPPE